MSSSIHVRPTQTLKMGTFSVNTFLFFNAQSLVIFIIFFKFEDAYQIAMILVNGNISITSILYFICNNQFQINNTILNLYKA